jgi:HAE1 family hydrophobic/amphiphilic exporter-1
MLNLTKFSINRPVTISMIFAIIALAAVFVLSLLPISYFPNVEFPRLNVNTYWSGASPEEVEKHITALVEEAGSTLQGVREVNSTSSVGRSSVRFYFDRNIDLEFARFELNEKLHLIRDRLPTQAQPQIQAYIPSQYEHTAFLEYGISGAYETWELKEMAEKLFLFRLSALNGISDVSIRGAREREVVIELRETSLDQVDYQKVRQALIEYGNRISVSNLRDKGRTMSIMLDDSFNDLHEIGKLEIVRDRGDRVRLGEIALIDYGLAQARTLRRYNGEPQVVLTITKENRANAIDLAAKTKRVLEEQAELLPTDITMVNISDEAAEITKDMKVLYQRGIFSLLIIFTVLVIFLRNFKSTLVVVTTIFLSIALTFILMFLFRIGLNMISLAGLALGFGMIVDNSIVIYENIFRNQNRGLSRRDAALIGVREVALPIVASTFTTMIVFAPFLFMQGDFKIIYMPFVNTMVLSLFSSLFISFTFIPFASTHILAHSSGKTISKEEFYFNPKLNFFQRILKILLRFRVIWIILVLIFLGYTIWIFSDKVDKGYVWTFPRDDYLSLRVYMPTGSNIEQTDFIIREFEDLLYGENVESWNTYVSGTYGRIRIDFDEETKKTAYPLIMREKLKAYAVNYGNTRVYVWGFGPSFGGTGATFANFHLKLKGYNYEELEKEAYNLKAFMESYSRRVANVNVHALSQWQDDILYEYEISFDRKQMAAHRVDIDSIIWQLYVLLQNQEGFVQQNIGNREYSFTIKEDDEDFDINALRSFICYNRDGQKVTLSSIAEINKVEVMSRIDRQDRLYQRGINFDFRGSPRLGREFVDELIDYYPLPLGYVLERDDDALQSDDEEDRKLILILIASIILVYMSLGALFESFRSPFVIILALPLAFIGVTYMFYFFDETFNAYARMGLILLAGIVVNNSIILVYRIIQLQEHGIALNNAILQATRDRARPIVMTSLTTIMGLIPMLIRTDVDKGDFWRMLAFSTIGGLTAATIFSIIVTPVLYRIFHRKKVEHRLE